MHNKTGKLSLHNVVHRITIDDTSSVYNILTDMINEINLSGNFPLQILTRDMKGSG